jgi:hypothetical protein
VHRKPLPSKDLLMDSATMKYLDYI